MYQIRGSFVFISALIALIQAHIYDVTVDDQLIFGSESLYSQFDTCSAVETADPCYNQTAGVDCTSPIDVSGVSAKYLRKPPGNKNWAIRDSSAGIRLGYGRVLDRKPSDSGATFRGNHDMGMHDGSCMYWKNGRLGFVHPGFNEYLVGVGSGFWDNSNSCGQCLLVYNPKNRRSVVSVITDYCPACARFQLDIHVAASAFLAGGYPHNSVPYKGGPENFEHLQVKRVECDWKGEKLSYFFDTGSNRFNWYVIISFLTVPAQKIVAENQKTREKITGKHDKYGRWVFSWKSGKGGAGNYNIWIHTRNTKVVKDVIYWNDRTFSNIKGRTFIPLSARAQNVRNWPMQG
ncbi:hypothetical protein MP228_006428 [Amoeboaphelidium protococcarum]|nr:hypothetical protein MP228_006428 [Amoeboaphelidium protococcarum]